MSVETESGLATRPSLLARLKDWSQQTAWREFDQDYAPLLRNIARKAGLTNAEVDDVVQETLIAVAKKIGTFAHAGNRGSFRSWLYQQARWRIADRFRARRQHGEPLPRPAGDSAAELPETALKPGVPRVEQSVDSSFQRLWDIEWDDYVRQTALKSVKSRVSPRQFQLFDLSVLQGLSVSDTAQAAGASKAAVYMAKSRVARLVKREAMALNRRAC